MSYRRSHTQPRQMPDPVSGTLRTEPGRASIDRMRLSLRNALRVASVPVGVGVGLWTALLTYGSPCLTSPLGVLNACPLVFARPIFATSVCALFGAGAAVMMLLVSVATTRLLPSPS